MENKFFLILLLIAFKAGAQTSALSIADSLYSVGKYSEAIEELESVTPKSDDLYLKLARFNQAAGKFNSALEYYETVLNENSERVLAQLEYAKLLKNAGHLKKSDSVFANLTTKYPGNASFLYERGLVKEKLKDSTAMSFFSIAAMYDKTHQQAHFKVAKDLLSKGRFAEAEHFSNRGLEANPNYVSLISILAQALYHQEKYPEAIDEFEKLVTLGEGSEFVHSRLGAAWAKGKRYEKAIEEYNLALDYEAENFVTHFNLGKLHAAIGNFKSSERHLLMAILLKDVSIDQEYFHLGLTYKLLKNDKKALDYFNKAIEENPDNERAWYERAIAADNYYQSLETRRKYYQLYLDKYEREGTRDLILLAKRRIADLNEEIHMSE